VKLDGSLGQLEISAADIPTSGPDSSPGSITACSSFVFEVVSSTNSELHVVDTGIVGSASIRGENDDGRCQDGKIIIADSYAGVRRVICKPFYEHHPWFMVVPTTGNITLEVILPRCE
jgi:hypothetical protein